VECSADCISLQSSNGVTTCVACIAEGTVRYWPNIAMKANMGEVEVNANDTCVAVINLEVGF
jgi:nuclear pore complex protein Nup133